MITWQHNLPAEVFTILGLRGKAERIGSRARFDVKILLTFVGRELSTDTCFCQSDEGIQTHKVNPDRVGHQRSDLIHHNQA